MGELFVDHITELHIDGCPIRGIEDFTVELDEVADEYIRDNRVVKFDENALSFTISCKWDRYLFWKVAGLWDWAFLNCPNRRVAHLMKYGRTARIRRKNFNRALNIMFGLSRKEK